MKTGNDETVLFLRKKTSVGDTRSAELITQILPGDAPVEIRLSYQHKLVGKLLGDSVLKAEQALNLVQKLEKAHQASMPASTIRYGITIVASPNKASGLTPFIEKNHTPLEIKADIKSWSEAIIPRKK